MKTLSFSTALLVPATAWAHPGHGATPGESLVHYLSEPLHAGIAVALAVFLLAAGYGVARARRRS